MTKVVSNHSPHKEKKTIKKFITKQNIIYLIIAIIDIALIIYAAKNNYINYVTIEDNSPIYLGAKHNLYFGRNYITLVITIIVAFYIIILNKCYLKNKVTLKYLLLPIIILLINSIIFYLFTNKIY